MAAVMTAKRKQIRNLAGYGNGDRMLDHFVYEDSQRMLAEAAS
ncbi:hypothetical protein [Domibacillus indicus]|nr:hypothetical protein [Domibacillus indicus]